eukprot:3142200-Rhodomonas_salina.2
MHGTELAYGATRDRDCPRTLGPGGRPYPVSYARATGCPPFSSAVTSWSPAKAYAPTLRCYAPMPCSHAPMLCSYTMILRSYARLLHYDPTLLCNTPTLRSHDRMLCSYTMILRSYAMLMCYAPTPCSYAHMVCSYGPVLLGPYSMLLRCTARCLGYAPTLVLLLRLFWGDPTLCSFAIVLCRCSMLLCA